MLQVLVGPVDETDGKPWYFSLNNRRLWVLKRCREEGMLQTSNNQVQVRVRTIKSTAETQRYTLANCVLEAKVMRESADAGSCKREEENRGKLKNHRKGSTRSPKIDLDDNDKPVELARVNGEIESSSNDSDDDDDDHDADDIVSPSSNRFSVLL